MVADNHAYMGQFVGLGDCSAGVRNCFVFQRMTQTIEIKGGFKCSRNDLLDFIAKLAAQGFSVELRCQFGCYYITATKEKS